MNPKLTVLLIYIILIAIPIICLDFPSSTNKFANNIYNILRRKEGNIFFSPISAHAVLSMAYQGAAGDTAKNLQHALHLPEANVTSRKYRSILGSLDAIEDVQLHIANNIYVQKGYTLKSDFRSVSNDFFMADIQSIDFKKSMHAAHQINTWVETKTNNKIRDVISKTDINEDTRVILVNAVYFKGLWLHSFNKQSTSSDKFYISNTATVKCEMMRKKERYFYAENYELDAKILKIPYVNERFNLIIILPNTRVGIKYLEKKLVHMNFYTLLRPMEEIEVIVYLPKFKIETKMDLTAPLSEMGLRDIFGNHADFSNMTDSPEPLYVSKIVQKAFIEVNEQGTEAAAATAVLMQRAMSTKPQFSMVVDHPFIVIITFRRIGKLYPIFMGRIMRPIN